MTKEDRNIKKVINSFFDFYSMYELYTKVGGFRELGYRTYDLYINENIYNKIQYAFEDIIDQFSNDIYIALLQSIKSEVKHFPSKTEYGNSDHVFKKIMVPKHNISYEMYKMAKKNPGDNLYLIYKLYNNVDWWDDYGGEVWAIATMYAIKYKDQKSYYDKATWCDQVLHLHHNTGNLLDKTWFSVLSDTSLSALEIDDFYEFDEDLYDEKGMTALDFRASSKSILEYLPFNSKRIKKLIIPRLNLFTPEQSLLKKYANTY